MSIDETVAVDFVGMDPRDVQTGPPFDNLFPIEPRILEAVVASMRDAGYDQSKPINVWRQTGLVLDGHTRRGAVVSSGIELQ